MKTYTEDEVRVMEAGKELDSLIEEKIFQNNNCLGIPNYSTNISDAWLIVEYLTKSLDEIITDEGEKYEIWTLDRLGFDCCKNGEPDIDGVHGQYRCFMARNKSDDIRDSVDCSADTVSLAICKCALLAKLKL